MKLLSLLFVFFASVLGIAAPAVGDSARFNVKIEENGKTKTGQYEVTLLAIDTAGNFKMRTVVAMDDSQTQISEALVLSGNTNSEDDVQRMFSYCDVYGLHKDQYTLPSSQELIETCVMPMTDNQGHPNGEIQLGRVPFGLVKQIQIDNATGVTITLEMTAYIKVN